MELVKSSEECRSSCPDLPAEVWNHILKELPQVESSVSRTEELPFECSCKKRSKICLKPSVQDLKHVRPVCKTLAIIAAPKLFDSIRINPYILPLSSGVDSFRDFATAGHAQHVRQIFMDDGPAHGWHYFWSDKCKDDDPELAQARKLLDELTLSLSEIIPRFVRVQSLCVGSEYFQFDNGQSPNQPATQKAKETCYIAMLRQLSDHRLLDLQGALRPFEAICASDWAALKLSAVTTLHLNCDYSRGTRFKSSDLVALMPNLRTAAFYGVDDDDAKVLDAFSNLDEIHIQMGWLTLKCFRALLERNAATLRKLTMNSTFAWREKAVQKAFRDLTFPRLTSMYLYIETRHQAIYEDDIENVLPGQTTRERLF